jgi:hypothetical protein
MDTEDTAVHKLHEILSPFSGHFFILHDSVFRNVRKNVTHEELIAGVKEFMNIVGSNVAVTSTVFDYEKEIVQSNCDGK